MSRTIGLLIAGFVVAITAPVHAGTPARAEARRATFVAINPHAAGELADALVAEVDLFAKPSWPVNKIIVPGNGAGSVLVNALLGTSGPRMPLRMPALAPEKIAAVKTWIDSGATEGEFIKTVQPVFKASCNGCHGTAGHAAGLVLESYQSIQTSVVGH
jgi:hypothetical protein